jgi:uncharacterized phage protein gp47/JayE
MNTLPTTSQIYSNLINNLQTQLGITNPIVSKTFLVPFCTALAAALSAEYKIAGQVQADVWPDTCDDDTLLRFGFIILGRYPYAAIQGQYAVTVTGTSGTTVPVGTVWVANNNSACAGQLFTNDSAYTLSGTSGSMTIRAMVGGTAARFAIGDTCNLTAPIINIGTTATVTAETVTPVDAETLPAYRSKILEKIQAPSGSWNAADYRTWGLTVAGVRQIYAYTDISTSNVVDVYVEGTTYGAIPSASAYIVGEVGTAINPLYPLGVHAVNYNSCATDIIAVTVIAGSFPPFTTAQQTLVTTAVRDFINTVRPFIAGADNIANRNDVMSAYNLYPVISGAVPGFGFSGLTFTVNGTAATTYQAIFGNIPYCSTVNFA